MVDVPTSLDEKDKERLRQHEHFKYPSTAARLAFVRDVVSYLKQTVVPTQVYPLADQVDSLSCRPLFIVSAGRSGTTLLRSMLVIGGQIAIPPEGQVVGSAARKYLAYRGMGWKDVARLTVALFESSGQFPLWQVSMIPVYERVISLPPKERSLARIVDEVYSHYARQHFPEATMWGDQSPIHSVFLPWLIRAFPRARFIHLLRDGRDAIASMVAAGFQLSHATERWKISVERVLAAQKMIPVECFFELRYERLVREPAETLKEVCHFLGIDYDPDMLLYWKADTTVEHHHFQRHQNLGQPVFTESIGRWRERLSEEEQVTVLGKVGPLLRRAGYGD